MGWKRWRNMVSEEKPLPDSFVPGERKSSGAGIDLATTKNVKWVARLGAGAYGNPTVAGGRVFVGTDALTVNHGPKVPVERMAGWSNAWTRPPANCSGNWSCPSGSNLPKDVFFMHQNLGTCSSPTVEGDRVYLVSSADEVVCLDVHGQTNPNTGEQIGKDPQTAGVPRPAADSGPADAKVIWRYDLINELNVSPHDAASCSVLIHGDVLYVGTSNGVDKSHERIVSPGAPALVALDKRTGRLLATENEKISTRLFHCQWSSPSLGEGRRQDPDFLRRR